MYLFKSKRYLGIIIILFISYAIRLFTYIQEPTLSRDGVSYLLQARGELDSNPVPIQIAGASFSSLEKHSPLFPSILHTMHTIGIDPQKGGIILNISCNTALCWIIWLSCRYIGLNPIWSLFSAFLVAVHPEFARCSHELQRESLYLFFCGLSFLLIIINTESTSRYKRGFAALFFALTGAAACTSRYEAWELLPLSLAWQVLIIIYKKQYNLSFLIERFSYICVISIGWILSLSMILKICNYSSKLYFENTWDYCRHFV